MQSSIHPLAELRAWLAESVAINRAMRWFRPAFRDSVAEDIVADVAANEAKARDAAYSAEQYDLSAADDLQAAANHLHAALQGGLESCDLADVKAAIQRVRAARKRVLRSAQKDHAATEMLAA